MIIYPGFGVPTSEFSRDLSSPTLQLSPAWDLWSQKNYDLFMKFKFNFLYVS